MNRAFIPLAAAVTFVAVYQLTPAPAPARQAVEPARVATAVPIAAPLAAARPVAAAAKRRSDRPRTARRRRAAAPAVRATVRAVRRPVVSVYYSGCNEVRAAGLAPLYRGDPGYRSGMDGDDDGIACEPHRGRR
ncbi:MAG TPA: excalibur calcium-binding domain-containing protein [Allosphingosinicella sp.]|jgi:hypothetical protein